MPSASGLSGENRSRGGKLGHQWYVYAADVPGYPLGAAASNGHVQTADVSVQDNSPDTSSAASAVSSAALQAAVDALAAQLAIKDQQIAYLHAVIAQLGAERLALPAPATAAADTTAHEATIAAQAETIAELRRRAEVAEQALATVAAQPPTANGHTHAGTTAEASSPAAQVRRPWWQFWYWGAPRGHAGTR